MYQHSNPRNNYFAASHVENDCHDLGSPTSRYYTSHIEMNGGRGYINVDLPQSICLSRTGDGNCSCLKKQ